MKTRGIEPHEILEGMKRIPRGNVVGLFDDYDKNFPKYFVPGPGEHVVRDVHFTDGTWNGFPVPKAGQNITVRIQAIVPIKPDTESKKANTWTGTVTSSTRSYTIWG